jgi:hypothetical protein
VVGRVIPLVFAAVLLVVSAVLWRSPTWFVDRSPATKYDPTVDRDVFVQQVRRMGLWGIVGGALLVLFGLLFLVARLVK